MTGCDRHISQGRCPVWKCIPKPGPTPPSPTPSPTPPPNPSPSPSPDCNRAELLYSSFGINCLFLVVFGIFVYKYRSLRKNSYRRRTYYDEEGGEELLLRSFRSSTPIFRGPRSAQSGTQEQWPKRPNQEERPRPRFLGWFRRSKPVEIPKNEPPRFTLCEDSPLLGSQTETTLSKNLKDELEQAEREQNLQAQAQALPDPTGRKRSFKTFKPGDEGWTSQLTPKQSRLLSRQKAEKLLREADKITSASNLHDVSLSTSEEL